MRTPQPRPAPTPWFKRWTVWLGIGAALAGAFVVYFLVAGLLTPESSGPHSAPNIRLHDVTALGQHGKELGWTFKADSTEVSTDGLVTKYNHVHAGTYYKDGKPKYRLTADSVMLDNRTLDYRAAGVHVVSVGAGQIQELRTGEARWNNGTQTLWCPRAVKVTYKGARMKTSTLRANFRTGEATLGVTSLNS